MELTFLYSKAIITSTPTQVLDPKFCTAAYILNILQPSPWVVVCMYMYHVSACVFYIKS